MKKLLFLFVFLFLSFTRAAFAADSSFDLTGTVVQLYDDNFSQSKSQSTFYLQPDSASKAKASALSSQKLIPLDNPKKIKLESGAQVRIKGTTSSTQKSSAAFALNEVTVTRAAAVRIAPPAPRAAVILATFPGQTYTSPTVASANALLNGNIRTYFSTSSYGQMNFAADTFGPVELPIQPTCDFWQITEQAVAAADSLIDYRQYGYVSVVFPSNNCTFAGRGVVSFPVTYSTQDGSAFMVPNIITAQAFHQHVITHEFGHNFGLQHANGLECGALHVGESCPSTEYADPWDAMGMGWGGISMDINAYHKLLLGWILIDQFNEVTQPGVYDIFSLEHSNTTSLPRALWIPIPGDRYYAVESRFAYGNDVTLPQQIQSGILVRKIGLVPGTNANSHLIDANPTATVGDYDFRDAAFTNYPFADPYNRVAVRFLSKANNITRVAVSFFESPVLNTPTDNAQTTSVRPLLDWSDVYAVSHYALQLATDPNFSNVLLTTVSATSDYQLTTDLPANQRIYWRVRADYGYTPGSWSSTWSFNTPRDLAGNFEVANCQIITGWVCDPLDAQPIEVKFFMSEPGQVLDNPFFPNGLFLSPFVDNGVQQYCGGHNTRRFAITPVTTNLINGQVRQISAYGYNPRNGLTKLLPGSPKTINTATCTVTRPTIQTTTRANGNDATMVLQHSYQGSNKFLVVAASYRSTGGQVQSMTYGGQNLQKIRGDKGGEYSSEVWILPTAAIPSSTELRVNFGSAGATQTDSHVITAMTATGVNQGTPMRVFSGQGANENPSIYTTPATNELTVNSMRSDIIIGVQTTYSDSNQVTIPGNQTQLTNITTGNVISTVVSATSDTDQQTVRWNTTRDWPWGISAISLIGY